MLAAASLFAGTTAYGAVVAVREGVPGEPFGRRSPGGVVTQVVSGMGTGTMAPWPMPVAALAAAVSARPGASGPGRVGLAVGSLCLVGIVIEPVTWGLRSGSRATTATTVLHLLSGVALVLAGRRAVLAARVPGTPAG